MATPAWAISSPPFLACASPSTVRSTSTQPVKRSSRFHWLWPWRSRIRVGKARLRLDEGEWRRIYRFAIGRTMLDRLYLPMLALAAAAAIALAAVWPQGYGDR